MVAQNQTPNEAPSPQASPQQEIREVEIIDVRPVPSTDPNRLGKMDTLVTYRVDQFRVYVVRIPKEEVTEEDIRKAIKEQLEKVVKWAGRRLTL